MADESASIRVFFSHSHEDDAIAERLVAMLKASGIYVWHAPAAIHGAQEWHDEIGRALKHCNWLLLLLTPRSVYSRWVKRELLYALRQPRYDGHILPMLYEDCDQEELSWTLEGMQKVDLRGASDDLCRQRILDTWRHELKRP